MDKENPEANPLSQELKKTLHFLRTHSDYVNVGKLPGVQVDLKYATEDNFMGRNVYGPFREAFLHRIAAEKLSKATELLQIERPGWKFLILDALRPRSIQRVLWAHVEGTPEEQYVASPDYGSVHNFGLAVDIGCLDEQEHWVEMGSGFDCFHPISQPKLEDQFLASGELSREHHRNRLLLRKVMTGAGFLQLPHEWWHYDALPREEIRSGYLLIE